jgi:nitrogen regulatory protein P-II 1
MKLITAVIKPFKIEDVKDALNAAGVEGMTLAEVQGFGRQSGHTEVYRGAEYTIAFLPKVRLDIVCADTEVERIAEVIRESAVTGKIGDGKLWVIDVGTVIRLRTGERDTDAI